MRRRRARWPRGDSRRTLAAQPRPAPPRPAAAPQLSHHVDAGWSDRLDQLLRSNVEADRNGVNKNKIRWESVAKMIPGMSADQCQARWTVLHTLPGLENKGISLLPNPHSARFGARRPGPPRPPSGMTPPPSRDAFAAGSRPGSAPAVPIHEWFPSIMFGETSRESLPCFK